MQTPHALEDTAQQLLLEPAGFVRARLDAASARARLRLGRVPRAVRWVACYRAEPFWMKPKVGRELADVPRDTQFLLLELDADALLLVVPLASAPFKATLEGDADGLWLVLDSGDTDATGDDAVVAYVAEGRDPYALCRDGAQAVAERLGSFELRRNKRRPAFAELFGWCTWDAFYQEVSEEKLFQGLEAFRSGGVEPRFLILDDGWQSVTPMPSGAPRLAAFGANAKFPSGLAASVRRAKSDYAVERFMVWHAVHGYWGGVDGAALSAYGVQDVPRRYSSEVLEHFPTANVDYWGPIAGRPGLPRLAAFYDDYHAALAADGVDGVKVDNQASVEALAALQGGRVRAMQQTHLALEKSVARHFAGELINCMSCSSEMFYADRSAALTRTSPDFYPDRPETHGLHVHTNALVGLWFGEIVHPDWDMFQSGHAVGPFHAAARAVSGSAVYVSDKPGAHDFALLRELVCSDGRALVAEDVGVPTRDSLFVDPVGDAALYKVQNRNRCGFVVGVFNATRDAVLVGTVAPSDVSGLQGGEFALYLKRADRLLRVAHERATSLELAPLTAEVASFAEVVRGVAALGLRDKLNGGAALVSAAWSGDTYELELRDGGSLLVLSEGQPKRVTSAGDDVPFTWLNQRLDVTLTKPGVQRVCVYF